MAQFDNVTFEYYKTTLQRSIVPTADDFNALKLENVQLMKSWMPYVSEKETNGIDTAVCLMIEAQYQDEQTLSGKSDEAVNSESVGGHSISFGSTSRNKLQELNAQSTLEKKIEKAKLFVSFNTGVK